MPHLHLDQLRTLAAVVEHGTFDAAAAELHVTPSAVSQRIRALEDSAGRILLRRDRPVTPTDAGEAVLRTARQMLHLERALGTELDGPDGTGGTVLVPVACNADSLATWFVDALAAVPARAGATFELRREDEDHSLDLLRRGEVMAAVTSDATLVPGCRTRPLGTLRYVAVASPDFVDTHLGGRDAAGSGVGSVRDQLGDVPVVDFDRRDGAQRRFVERLTGRPPTGPRHFVPSTHDHLRAVAAGLGWALAPESLVAPWLADGRLVGLVPDEPVDVPLHWQHWRVRSPALDALTDAVVATAAAALRPATDGTRPLR